MFQPDGEGHGERCNTLGCSLDIAPTIMARLGGEYRSVFFGRDVVTTHPEDGRALMQHNHDVTVLNPQHQLVNLGFNHSAWEFDVAANDFALTQKGTPEPEHLKNTAALFQTAFRLYYADKWFPGQSSPRGTAQNRLASRRASSR